MAVEAVVQLVAHIPEGLGPDVATQRLATALRTLGVTDATVGPVPDGLLMVEIALRDERSAKSVLDAAWALIADGWFLAFDAAEPTPDNTRSWLSGGPAARALGRPLPA
jgi:hypothetical protein